MKKFLNKKVNVFGKAVPVFAFVILGLALTSAALVPYLSGMVTGNTIVNSPIVLSAADGEVTADVKWGTGDVPDSGFSEGADSLDLTATAYGGHSEGFWIKMENQADRTFFDAENLYLVFEIEETSGEGITEYPTGEIGDLDAMITIYDWVEGSSPLTKQKRGPYDVESIMPPVKVADNIWRIYTGVEFFTAGAAGDDIYAYVNIDFELNALGTYEIRASVFGNDKLADISNGIALEFPTA